MLGIGVTERSHREREFHTHYALRIDAKGYTYASRKIPGQETSNRALRL